MRTTIQLVFAMDFPKRLTTLRKKRGLTQQALAELVGIHFMQISRYETGKAQPTLDVFKKLVVALGVPADALLFKEGERGPDEDLALEFEALSRFSPEEKRLVKSVLKGLILKHEAEKWPSAG